MLKNDKKLIQEMNDKDSYELCSYFVIFSFINKYCSRCNKKQKYGKKDQNNGVILQENLEKVFEKVKDKKTIANICVTPVLTAHQLKFKDNQYLI